MHTQKKRARQGKMNPEKVRLFDTLSVLGGFSWPPSKVEGAKAARGGSKSVIKATPREINKADFLEFSKFLGLELKYWNDIEDGDSSWAPIEYIILSCLH